jgi:hypothetical protein
LILYGALYTLDNDRLVGVAVAVQAPNRELLDALLEGGWPGFAFVPEVEVHNWEFGGRR